MLITFFSFLMSILWSSVMIVLLYILRKNKYFIRGFGIASIVLLYIFCAFRMILPLEFGFTKVVAVPRFYNDFYETLIIDKFSIINTQTSIFYILLIIWVLVAAILLSIFCIRYYRSMKILQNYAAIESDSLNEILEKVKKESHKKIDIKVFFSPDISVPMGIGVLHKSILLPSKDYSDNEIFYILKHEYTHFANGDLIVKMLIHIFCCIFWWNPFAYLLRKDLSQVLEIKCDLTIASEFDNKEKSKYLSVMVDILKVPCDDKIALRHAASTLLNPKDNAAIVERFEMVSTPKSTSNRSFQAMWIALFVIIIAVSYTFVLQPSYETPPEEMGLDEGWVEIEPGDIIIFENVDGTYSQLWPFGVLEPIDEATAKTFVEEGALLKQEGDTYELTPQNSYIVALKDGGYKIMYPTGGEHFTNNVEFIDEMIEKGFEIRKE